LWVDVVTPVGNFTRPVAQSSQTLSGHSLNSLVACFLFSPGFVSNLLISNLLEFFLVGKFVEGVLTSGMGYFGED
jgi:hypothetical protein